MILQANDLTYQIDRKILVDSISLTVQPGEFLALVGPNGAGKSTLLKMLSGDIVPTRGSVAIGQRPVGDCCPQELALCRAVMPQSAAMPFGFLAKEIVQMGRYVYQKNPIEQGQNHAVIRRVMYSTETLWMANRTFPSLSGGEQSRVTFARVLAQQTPILLLDEPTAHLDVNYQHKILCLARDCAKEGAAVVAVVHDLNLAAMYGTRMGILTKGKLCAIGSPNSVLVPSLLREVFHTHFHISKHPILSCPFVLPLPPDTYWQKPAGEGERLPLSVTFS